MLNKNDLKLIKTGREKIERQGLLRGMVIDAT